MPHDVVEDGIPTNPSGEAGAPEIEITPEMVEAGADAIFGWLPNDAMPGSESERRTLS